MSFDSQDFRPILSRYATGVVAVTTRWQDRPYGMTVNSFTSVSLQPPLVLFCAVPGGQTVRAIEQAEVYAVSILSEQQMPLCQRLAGKNAPDESDRFAGLEYTASPGAGVPWMTDCLGWLECRLIQLWPAGDHVVLLGEVTHLRQGVLAAPLLFFNGQWPTIQRPAGGVV